MNCSQFFSDQNVPSCATMAESDRSRSPVPGRNRADPGAPIPNQYGKSCRSFLDGVGPCKRQFGNRNGCHGLSLDLSSVLSSTCHSRDLILEIHPWVRSLPRSRAHGPFHVFHRHLLHLLHPLWHIHFQVVHQLHHAHLHCHVHPLKWHRPALHPFLRPSLVKPALHTWTHQVVTQRLMTAAPMDLIPILIGKRIKTTTTIRRSTAWLPSLHSSISLHAKTGHWRMWSSETTSGSPVVSTGKQLLASEAGSWAWSLLDSDWGHCSCCVHDGALDSTPQQRGRHG